VLSVSGKEIHINFELLSVCNRQLSGENVHICLNDVKSVKVNIKLEKGGLYMQSTSDF